MVERNSKMVKKKNKQKKKNVMLPMRDIIFFILYWKFFVNTWEEW